MTITADRERCEGHGVCVNQAPTLLDLDDDDVVVILDPARDLTEQEKQPAQVAVASCPVAALALA
jgi:ferredoxin